MRKNNLDAAAAMATRISLYIDADGQQHDLPIGSATSGSTDNEVFAAVREEIDNAVWAVTARTVEVALKIVLRSPR